jgi:hypothetical protein
MYQMQYPHETSSNQTFNIIIYCCLLILSWKLYNWASHTINYIYAWAFSLGIVWKVQLQEMRHNFCFSILILSLGNYVHTFNTLCLLHTLQTILFSFHRYITDETCCHLQVGTQCRCKQAREFSHYMIIITFMKSKCISIIMKTKCLPFKQIR